MDEFFARRNALADWHLKAQENGVEEIIQFQPSDVLILGPRKTGTTWLQQIFHQIRMRGDENFTDIYDVTKSCSTYCSSFAGYLVDGPQVGTPRIFKSHGSFEVIPKIDGMMFAIVVRDPLDTVWSNVKFATRFFGYNRDMTYEEMTRLYSSTSPYVLSPWQFICNWFPHKEDPNVLWLHYEDLLKNLKFCIQKCADFIKVELTETELDRIYQFCTFDYMSSHTDKFSGGELLDALRSLSQHTGDWQSQLGMVRSDGGNAGQGRKLMSADMKEFVNQSWKDSVEKSLGFATYHTFYETNSLLKKEP